MVDDVDDLVTERLGRHHARGDGALVAGRGDLERLGPDAGDEGPVARQARRGREHEPAGTAQGTVGDLHLQQVHRRRADERGAEQARRSVVDLQRRPDLLHAPLVEDGDAVAERHRLDLVVGDVDHRRAQLGLQVLDLRADVGPQLRVEVGERLVHEERARSPHERPRQGDALLLASGEALRLAVEQPLELHHPRDLLDPCGDLLLGLALRTQREGEVVAGPEVRVEGVELEHHRDVALGRRQVVDQGVPDVDVTGGLALQAGHGAQGGGLAAAGGAEHDEELAVADGQVDVLDRHGAVRVRLVQRGDLDARHQRRTAPRVTPATRCLRTR